MSTNREVINRFRKKIQERSADSTFTNQDLYFALLEQGMWLIRREVAAGRIYNNNSFFQTLGCQEVEEVSPIDACCPVKTNCKIYRTKDKLPEMWIDTDGPIIRQVVSVDGSTDFTVISPNAWLAKKDDPYQKMYRVKYVFPGDGYLWFPEFNPHRINIVGFYREDISDRTNCAKSTNECSRFLDKIFPVPEWLEAEMMAKALQTMFPSKQLPEDEDINKNSNRKN